MIYRLHIIKYTYTNNCIAYNNNGIDYLPSMIKYIKFKINNYIASNDEFLYYALDN